MVVANPALIGQTVKANLLLSDDADLYLKGVGTAISRFPGTRGIANPSATSGEVTVLTASNDFAPFLLDIKKALAERAAKLRDDADVPGTPRRRKSARARRRRCARKRSSFKGATTRLRQTRRSTAIFPASWSRSMVAS